MKHSKDDAYYVTGEKFRDMSRADFGLMVLTCAWFALPKPQIWYVKESLSAGDPVKLSVLAENEFGVFI